MTRKIIEIPLEQISPDPAGVFLLQGIPRDVDPPERVIALYEEVVDRFMESAAPIGIMADVSLENFLEIYRGTGANEPDTPLEHIVPRAGSLAFFAFTLGQAVSDLIESHFNGKKLAQGYMLDSIASFCADKASEAAQQIYLERLTAQDSATSSTRVLMYSPGYCGWHVSGQGKLFQYLQPEKIGITLNDSFLMIPLKSISGVLVAGDWEIHRFTSNYPFCSQCKTRTCRV